jgi:[acyl-carrier-protein] S-malonyltransferase
MSKTAIVFPGQGRSRQMGKSFYDEFDSARKTYEEANDALGYDIARLSFEGPRLRLTKRRTRSPRSLRPA